MLVVLFGLFGLIVGSFLSVLIVRGGVRALSGRSACMSCGRGILWYDLIPVLSWMWLRGRCRFCGSKISAQYPLVELATALLFAVLGAAPIHIILRLLALPISALLIAISVYDLRHTIIPDAWVWTFNGLALFSIITIEGSLTAFNISYALLSGPAVALPLFTLWLVSRGRWMGLGDAKLALGIGWLLGPFLGIGALFLAFIIGALVSVFILLPLPHVAAYFSKRGIARLSNSPPRLTMKSEIPFGPFLVASCLFVWISQMYGVPFLFLWQ